MSHNPFVSMRHDAIVEEEARVALAKAKSRGGYLVAGEVEALAKHESTRLQQVLVRCNMSRFTCSAQDLPHLKRAIESVGDWIRDVSLTGEAA